MAAKSSLPWHALDLEPPVLALVRQAVLEHDHRAHVVGALDVAHVVALDAQRGLGQAERVLQLVERLGPAVVVGGAAQPVPDELLAGVPRDRLEQLALVAPLRAPGSSTCDPRCSVSHSSYRSASAEATGTSTCLGTPDRRRRRSRAPRGCVSTSSPGVTSSTLSITKPLRPTTRPRRTKKTWTAASRSSSAMPITSTSSVRSATICCLAMALRTRVEPVAQPGGPLELELVGRLAHLLLEPVHDRVGVAVEEVDQLVDQHRRRRRGRSRRRTAPSTSRCGTAGRAARAADGGRACCPSRCGSGTCAAAGRASRGWRRRGRRARSSARPCACAPRITIARGHSSSSGDGQERVALVVARGGC